MIKLIERIFRKDKDDKIQTRLTDSEAITIACTTEIAADHKDKMTLVKVIIEEGRPIWVVNSATMGSMIEVVIDDATGNVIKAGRIGIR